MIAPNVVIVAFDHGYSLSNIPMCDQKYIQKKITIKNDVWIGANTTITKGVIIGEGAIVGANALVLVDVKPFYIVGVNKPPKLGRQEYKI